MFFLLVLSIDTHFAPELSILDGVTPYSSEGLAGSEGCGSYCVYYRTLGIGGFTERENSSSLGLLVLTLKKSCLCFKGDIMY